jgi:release factor glutamine methyltransferase
MADHLVDYPIEYSNWKVNFFGRDFVVTPDVLIPRLETESLVRRARQVLNSSSSPEKGRLGGVTQRGIHSSGTPSNSPFSRGEWNHKTKITVIDIGCGSGIIGTSVADLADEVIFLDISPTALAIAEANFRTHFPDKKAQFIVSDLLSVFSSPHFRGSQRGYSSQPPLQGEEPGSNTLFLTNLPYIKDEEWVHMSADTIHEPRLALFGWEKTGFELYERLFQEFSSVELWNCNSVKLLFEFGFDQREIAEVVLQKYPQWEYSFFADYAGVERFGEVLPICLGSYSS